MSAPYSSAGALRSQDYPQMTSCGESDASLGPCKSIKNFVNQEELIEILKSNKFYKPNYKNLSGGIVSIHSGWKI